jgi:hypothetical protein
LLGATVLLFDRLVSLILHLRHEVARFEWTRGLGGWLMSIA